MKAKYGIQDSYFYNFDETGFMIGFICAGIVITRADSKEERNYFQPEDREFATEVQNVNCAG